MSKPRGPKKTYVADPCPACNKTMKEALTYFCVKCGAHNDHMYRREHRDRALARHVGREQIIAEYRAVGRGAEWGVS